MSRYLGWNHTFSQAPDSEKTGVATTLTLEMKAFFEQAVNNYKAELDIPSLPRAATPYLAQDTELTAHDAEPGERAKTAASHLMKLLFGARMSEPWLSTCISRLAFRVGIASVTRLCIVS